MRLFVAIILSLAASYTHAAEPFLRLCTDTYYKGHCEDWHYSNNKCIRLPENLEHKISSVYIGRNDLRCTFYEGYYCNGAHYNVIDRTGSEYLSQFNDKMGSFKCSYYRY